MSPDQSQWSRRRFVKFGLAGLAGLQMTAFGQRAAAAALPKVEEGVGAARMLAYVHDASAIDVAKRGGSNRTCATCVFYTEGSDGWGPCTLFPGESVSARGWCKRWDATS